MYWLAIFFLFTALAFPSLASEKPSEWVPILPIIESAPASFKNEADRAKYEAAMISGIPYFFVFNKDKKKEFRNIMRVIDQAIIWDFKIFLEKFLLAWASGSEFICEQPCEETRSDRKLCNSLFAHLKLSKASWDSALLQYLHWLAMYERGLSKLQEFDELVKQSPSEEQYEETVNYNLAVLQEYGYIRLESSTTLSLISEGDEDKDEETDNTDSL